MASTSVTGRRDYVYTNWAGTVTCEPETYYQPQSVQEIRQILAVARLHQKRVKVVGKCHSFSHLPTTDGYMINLMKMTKVTEINREDMTVTVESGILLKDLNDILDDNGLALSILPVTVDVTLGGAIATGSHGTGANFGILSTYILEMTVITAGGDVRKISKADGDVFSATLVSLGTLGIMTEIKIKCEPKFDVTTVMHGLPLKDVLEQLSVHLSASEHFSFNWYPYTDKAVVLHSRRTQPRPLTVAPTGSFWDKLIRWYLVEFLLWLSTFFQFIIPYVSRYYYSLGEKRVEFSGRSCDMFVLSSLHKHTAYEWAVPRDQAALAIYELQQWVLQNNYPIHFPVIIRFCAADDILLSPAYQRNVCYININSFRPYNKDCKHEKLVEACRKIMLKVGGSIHWAKINESTYGDIEDMYPGTMTFLKVRKKLDPDGMFLNNAICKMFKLE